MKIDESSLLFLRPDGSSYKAYLFLCSGFKSDGLFELKKFLTQKELQKYESILSDSSKKSFLIGRYCVKKALNSFVKKSLAEIEIINGVFGQPFIVDPDFSNFSLSISHGNDVAAAIVFEKAHPLAIDVEDCDEEKEKLIATYLTKPEKELLRSVGIPEKNFYFILWSAKEALSKMLKTGLTTGLELFEIDTLSAESRLDGPFSSTYSNFVQYRANSYLLGGHVCSIVFPKNSKIIVENNHLWRQ